MRCVTGLRPRNRRSTAIRSRSAPMDSLLSVVALGPRVSTRNGTNSGGAYQWGARAAPRTRQRHDHIIAAAAERLRSTCVLRLWPRPTRPCLPTPRLSLRSGIYEADKAAVKKIVELGDRG